MSVAGVDGCRAGWVVALRDGADVEVEVVGSIAAVLAATVDAIAIDIPIGLPADGPRPCDLAARRLLGPRRSSVFPAPTRAAMEAHDAGFAAALAANRAVCGRGISLQAFHLLPKIAEVDRALTPAHQARVAESHPELAFARLGAAPSPHPKRTAAGRADRIGLLEPVVPAIGHLVARRSRGCAVDDVLDAVALTCTAMRLHAGTAERLGGEVDDRGLRMEIAW